MRDDRNPPNSLRRNCSKCKANRSPYGGRTNKITRLWRCAACLQQSNETVNRSNPQHP